LGFKSFLFHIPQPEFPAYRRQAQSTMGLFPFSPRRGHHAWSIAHSVYLAKLGIDRSQKDEKEIP
jgi:hypothetical protein